MSSFFPLALRTKLVRFGRSKFVMAFPLSAGFHQASLSTKGQEHEQLFQYTSGHWLYNDLQQRAVRYVKFDVSAMQRVACESVGANSCTNFVKLAEGSYNKVFHLTFDNASEAIVRIPCPLAGPRHLTTASEVATLEFVRTELGVPVPRVFAWNSRVENNPVGVEYIIMERLPGVTLHSRWEQIAGPEAMAALRGLFAIEGRFPRRHFSQIGSLYFKEDVSLELQKRPLFLEPDGEKYGSAAAEKYRIGPLVDRHWWRGQRATMALDRGPWLDLQSYLIAAARCEQAWLTQYGNSMTSVFRRPNQHTSVSDHITMLDIYASVAPLIVAEPVISPELRKPTLWHPDISLSNIIVSPGGRAEIQGLIDWQGAWTAPYCMQATFPMAMEYDGELIEMQKGLERPSLPDDIEQRSLEEQETIRLHHRFAMRHKAYEHYMATDPRRVDACGIPHLVELCMLPYHAVRSWSDGLVLVRQSLLQLSQQWDDISLPGSPCPIHFTPDTLEAHKQEFSNYQKYQESITMLYKLVGAEGDGWVPNEHFDKARKAAQVVEREWNDSDRGGPFPFKDGMYSFFLS